MIGRTEHALFERLHDAASRVVIATHVNPDGDALGSEIGLARFLVSRGKAVTILNADPTPAILRFIESDRIEAEVFDDAQHAGLIEKADLVVLVDNSAPDRLGRMEAPLRAAAARTLCIDHHPARETPWAHLILDEEACATAVLVFELTTACGFEPDHAAAEALYVGLATDTGFFRYASTNSRAHDVASALLRRGVRPGRAYQQVYERNSVAFTRLLGHALAGLRLDGDGTIASVRITRELMRKIEAESVDTSDVTTALLAIDGIQVALLFRELADGRVKVSLRSKGRLDVHRLAGEFGGGGHRNASGIVTTGALDAVAEHVTGRAVAALAAGPPPSG